MKRNKNRFLTFALAVAASLGAVEASAQASCPRLNERLSAKEYCERYAALARNEMLAYGIPASVTLAQGMLESDWGSSYLAVMGNNHFGIKAYRVNYTKNVIHCDDDAKAEPFCAFNSVEEGYHYHSVFLRDNTRYNKLFSLSPSDYVGWANGLRECGYATDPQYGPKLISIIERYNLDQYDVINRVRTIYATSNDPKWALRYVRVDAADDLNSISNDTGVSVKKLLRYNDMQKGQPLKEGQVIYLEAKKRKGQPGNDQHVVKVGDSLWSISQMYGISLRHLKRLNKLRTSSLHEGQVLRLR